MELRYLGRRDAQIAAMIARLPHRLRYRRPSLTMDGAVCAYRVCDVRHLLGSIPSAWVA